MLWEITIDSAPPDGIVIINNGAATTSKPLVSLRTPAWDAHTGVTDIQVSNSPQTSGGLLSQAKLFPYYSPIPWDLTAAAYGGTSAYGGKTVYLQYRDGTGKWSPVRSDSISYAAP